MDVTAMDEMTMTMTTTEPAATTRVPLRRITGRTVALAQAHIDTDRIIPARFLTTTVRGGLGRHLFADWRFDADGRPARDFPLNRPEARGASVLVTGENFGCGSSREHAVWALLDFGFRAVVAPSFGDIFRQNALKNGLVPVVVPPAAHGRLLVASGEEVTIDLEACALSTRDGAPDGETVRFPLDPFARHCLLAGVDEMGYLVGQEEAIASFEAGRARGAR
jgi:3-isopropylmalate/(R)-2-methylmalate dehydratase small subunit